MSVIRYNDIKGRLRQKGAVCAARKTGKEEKKICAANPKKRKFARHTGREEKKMEDNRTREFDSCIIKTVLAGRIKPVLFLSNFLH